VTDKDVQQGNFVPSIIWSSILIVLGTLFGFICRICGIAEKRRLNMYAMFTDDEDKQQLIMDLADAREKVIAHRLMTAYVAVAFLGSFAAVFFQGVYYILA
jgi:hypothetical protein